MSIQRSLEIISSESPKNIEELLERVAAFSPASNLEVIRKAYIFSEKAHSGQVRRSGEPYIIHPLGVAAIIADLGLDEASIVTGLLHDTVEDTGVSLEEIQKLFGNDVRELVDGVTKISQMSFKNTHQKQGENIRKMIVAMGKDIRVILVKLADRLHNMRTLNSMPYHKQQSIARETLDIYAPLANRLGISSVKIELEDLSFRYLYPDIFYELVQKVAKKKKEREKYVEEVRALIEQELQVSANMKCEIQGRSKHLYSIYKKMEKRSLEFDQIYDLLAFRIIVNTVGECYQVLGQIHSIWKPVPGRFKDYIALAKSNNYQSLHTTLIGPQAEQIEIQIRTHDMHLVAERGIAAHWKYKDSNKINIESQKQFSWLREMITNYHNELDAGEYLENVKTDLFESEIYVFTPAGDLKELPDGAGPIDFAFSIHTDVGNRCTGAKVNGRIVPLKHRLKSGDTVEIITSKTQNPSKDWLKFCVTSRAKSKIRAFIQNEERKRSLELGKDLSEKYLRKYELSPTKFFKTPEFEKYLKSIGGHSLEDFYINLGYGKTDMEKVIRSLVPETELKAVEVSEQDKNTSFLGKVFSSVAKKKKADSIIVVDGMSDVLVRYAKCCSPIPGDSIVGLISRGRGVTVHNSSCSAVFEVDKGRQIDVSWSDNVQTTAITKVRISAQDDQGLLSKVSQAFTSTGVNIINARVRTTKDKKAVFYFDIQVKDTKQLALVIQNVQKIKGIIGVERI